MTSESAARVPDPPPQGTTCLLAAVSDAVGRHEPAVTEDVLFLLGGGNRMDYRFEEREGMPRFFLGHHAMDIVERFCARFEIPHALREGEPAPQDVLPELRAHLAGGNPVIAWVDISRLPYTRIATLPDMPHALTIEAESQETLQIADYVVPLSMYKDNVTTHRGYVRVRKFAAWSAMNHRRHLIDFQSLARRRLDVSERTIAGALKQAATDYLYGGKDYPPVPRLLERFADDLPRINVQYPGRTCSVFYNFIAANIRYYGILWARSLLADSLVRRERVERGGHFASLARDMQDTLRYWKSLMLSIVKMQRAENERQAVANIAGRIRHVLDNEQALYERLYACVS